MQKGKYANLPKSKIIPEDGKTRGRNKLLVPAPAPVHSHRVEKIFFLLTDSKILPSNGLSSFIKLLSTRWNYPCNSISIHY